MSQFSKGDSITRKHNDSPVVGAILDVRILLEHDTNREVYEVQWGDGSISLASLEMLEYSYKVWHQTWAVKFIPYMPEPITTINCVATSQRDALERVMEGDGVPSNFHRVEVSKVE